jgi:TonB family protein
LVPTTVVAAFVACGGPKPETPKTPDTSASASAATAAASGAASSVSTGGPSTTLALDDAGGGGTKLAETGKDAGAAKSPDGGTVCDPGRCTADIQARVNAVRDQARACYDEGLKAHPGIEGDLTVKFVIDPKGVINDVSIDQAGTRILEDSVQKCVMDVIKKLKFPESPRGVETRTRYPFNFRPKK